MERMSEENRPGAGIVDLALVHYPVVNRRGEEIGSAVTNLDIHDIARAARTFGVRRFYIITPYDSQLELVREIVAHWVTGVGGDHNPDRREALSLVRPVRSLDDAVVAGDECLLVGTSAVATEDGLSWSGAGQLLEDIRRILLVFGTASGLAPEVMARMDHFLPPIAGRGDYNHLPVRSAVAIILDRLLGSREYPVSGRKKIPV